MYLHILHMITELFIQLLRHKVSLFSSVGRYLECKMLILRESGDSEGVIREMQSQTEDRINLK